MTDIRKGVANSPPREGDHYKTVKLYGKRFELFYGYYEDCDRQNPLCDPIPIYPDFKKEPMYTDDGQPFITVVQDSCELFSGIEGYMDESTCAECEHFQLGEDWIGICKCPQNQERVTHKTAHTYK